MLLNLHVRILTPKLKGTSRGSGTHQARRVQRRTPLPPFSLPSRAGSGQDCHLITCGAATALLDKNRF